MHPPLELSHQVVHFASTPLYDVSTVSLHVVNAHTSSNEFTHPVPRIGKGECAGQPLGGVLEITTLGLNLVNVLLNVMSVKL